MNDLWLHRFAVFAAFCTFLLIGVGGLVTSHGVGMAVPDWPTTYGYNMFYFPFSGWVGGILYEHSHRLWASWVGFLTMVLAVWLHGSRSVGLLRIGGWIALALGVAMMLRMPERSGLGVQVCVVGLLAWGASKWVRRIEPSPRWLRRLGWVAFIAVVVQGVLGGLRVVLYRDQLGIFHATLAQLFLVLLSAIALFTSRWWRDVGATEVVGRGVGGLRWGVTWATVLVAVQLVLGASMRHQHAGLAVPDFPLAYGRVWPPMDPAFVEKVNRERLDARDYKPITAFQIGLHMSHRVGALVVFGAVGWVAMASRKRLPPGTWVRRWTGRWFGLIVAQAGLGVLTIWTVKAADVATAHVMLGAASLVLGGLISAVVWKFSVEASRSLLHSRTKFHARDGNARSREDSVARSIV